MTLRIFRSVAVAAVCLAGMASFADDLADKGRAILDKNKASIVTVRIVIKMQMSMPQFGSQEEEQKTEATGTVIDPSGLTVLSLNATDPTSFIEKMMESGGREGFEMKSSISDMKILQNDGTEIAAQVVLRDRDLDLAFIRPTDKPKNPMPALDISKGAAPGVLDPIITLNRLGKVASREYAVSIERICAIVTRPRTFYVMGHDPTQTSLGCPALTLNGEPIGICVLRAVKGSGDSGGMMGGMMGGSDNILPIVIPASDVVDVAKQAPAVGEEAKEIGTKEEKKKEEKKDDKEPAEKPKGDEKPKEKSDGTITIKPETPKA